MNNIRVIVSGGGTGGHIFPALSIANKLKELNPQTEILFVGADGRMEMEKVPAAGYEFVNWTLNGEVVSTEAVYTTTAVTETRSYVATFKFKPVDPREVKVASNDAAKGYATIVSPATSESSIVTGEIVTVKAVAANEDNVFVNWTVNGVEVSTEATYTYTGAEAVTLTANFATRYTITINQISGGNISVKQGATTIYSGDRVGEGTTLTITAKGSVPNWVKAIMVNGENVMTTSQAQTYTATVKVKSSTTMCFGVKFLSNQFLNANELAPLTPLSQISEPFALTAYLTLLQYPSSLISSVSINVA